MLFHYYVAESLWRDQQQALDKRIRRGDFIDYDIKAASPDKSIIKRWLSTRKKKGVNPQV